MISKRLLLGLLLCMSIAAERAGAEELRVFVTASSFSERLDVILEFDAGGNVVNTLVPDDNPRWGITEQGNSLYVLETVTKSLVRYELDGTGGQQLATFANPTNFIESNSQGNLYVVDSQRNVSRLDSEGNPNLQFSTGREFPTGIDADADGNIYVAANFSTSGEFRFGIEKFDAHGAFVSQLVLPPDDFPVARLTYRSMSRGSAYLRTIRWGPWELLIFPARIPSLSNPFRCYRMWLAAESVTTQNSTTCSFPV